MDEFHKAAERVKQLKTRPSDDKLLELYGLFKQATVGDVNISKPGFWDPQGQAKWEAWNQCQSIPKEKAASSYVRLVKRLESRD